MEGEHGTSCRSSLPAATSPIPDSLRKESTYTHSLYQYTLIEEYVDWLYVDSVLSFLEVEILPVSHKLFREVMVVYSEEKKL